MHPKSTLLHFSFGSYLTGRQCPLFKPTMHSLPQASAVTGRRNQGWMTSVGTRPCTLLAVPRGDGLRRHREKALSIGQGLGHICRGTLGRWDEAKAGSCSHLGRCSPLTEHGQPGGGQCSFSHHPKAPALPTAFAHLLHGAEPCLG